MSETPQEQPPGLTDMIESIRQASPDAGWSGADPTDLFTPLRDRMRGMLQELENVQSATYEGVSGLPDDEERPDEYDERERRRRVVAEVDGRGKLLRIDIGPYAMRDLDAEQLSRACTEAILAARAELATKLAGRLTELTGFEIPSGGGDEPAEEPIAPQDIMRRAKEAAGWNG